MKVIYKKSIIDKLLDAIAEARLHEKEIEKIVLTKEEACEFLKSCSFTTTVAGGTFFGVRVEVEGK